MCSFLFNLFWDRCSFILTVLFTGCTFCCCWTVMGYAVPNILSAHKQIQAPCWDESNSQWFCNSKEHRMLKLHHECCFLQHIVPVKNVGLIEAWIQIPCFLLNDTYGMTGSRCDNDWAVRCTEGTVLLKSIWHRDQLLLEDYQVCMRAPTGSQSLVRVCWLEECVCVGFLSVLE